MSLTALPEDGEEEKFDNTIPMQVWERTDRVFLLASLWPQHGVYRPSCADAAIAFAC
jgi:hypothetical protein